MEKSFFTDDGEPIFTNFEESLNEFYTTYFSIFEIITPETTIRRGISLDTISECLENNVILPDDFDPNKFDKKIFLQKLDDHHKKAEHFLNMLDEFCEFIELAKAEVTESLGMKEFYSKIIDEYVKSDLKKRREIALCNFDHIWVWYLFGMFEGKNKNKEDDNNSEASLN